ncbi:unnamed protein product [Callosobruchus maculatus]|uniref:Uncharacterized protein n=1 Tax=Callosobruchus maculatus TaxID=64391 RepID=A0A653DWX0_CALMS|nr:unnamed protein product [Callosobruchus maculatus]
MVEKNHKNLATLLWTDTSAQNLYDSHAAVRSTFLVHVLLTSFSFFHRVAAFALQLSTILDFSFPAKKVCPDNSTSEFDILIVFCCARVKHRSWLCKVRNGISESRELYDVFIFPLFLISYAY